MSRTETIAEVKTDDETCYFEVSWKPQCWDRRFRFVFIRTRAKKQQKGPIQLDLFMPYEYSYEFKVIVTNKTVKAKKVAAFHEGRGAQERLCPACKSAWPPTASMPRGIW